MLWGAVEAAVTVHWGRVRPERERQLNIQEMLSSMTDRTWALVGLQGEGATGRDNSQISS